MSQDNKKQQSNTLAITKTKKQPSVNIAALTGATNLEINQRSQSLF